MTYRYKYLYFIFLRESEPLTVPLFPEFRIV